jgi:hypothetical protein
MKSVFKIKSCALGAWRYVASGIAGLRGSDVGPREWYSADFAAIQFVNFGFGGR